MPEEIRVGPVGRVVLAVVAIAIILGTFVALARTNLQLSSANAQLTTANTQLTMERDALQRRVTELVSHPVTLPPGLVKPAAPLGESRWAGDRYIFIPPMPKSAKATTVPSTPPTPPARSPPGTMPHSR